MKNKRKIISSPIAAVVEATSEIEKYNNGY